MSVNDPIPPEAEREIYLRGIELFNEHDYFEAHETWEDIWHMAYGLKHDFYQGMIQCAVALEHYNRSNARGVSSLYKSYNIRFKDVPRPLFMGLDVSEFLKAMDRVLLPVVQLNPLPDRGVIVLDHSMLPKIQLAYDPFERGEAQRFNRPEKF